MLFSRLMAAIIGVSLAAVAADPPPQVVLEGDVSNLYPAAHLTGGLKFSHGAFISTDAKAGRFYTFGRNGDLLATAKIDEPEDGEYHISDFDRFSDGSIVAAALPSPFTEISPLLAFISPDGKTKSIVRTGVYFPQHLVIARDGTVWTLGYEMVYADPKDPAIDPNAGILRQYGKSGTALAAALPQKDFSRELGRISHGKLFSVQDHLGWYSDEGGKGKYLEISTDNIEQHVLPGLPKLAGHRLWDSQIEAVAATVGGDVLVSGDRGRTIFLFDRSSSQWTPLNVPPLGGYPFTPRLLGADGDDLVFEYALSAGFFRIVR